MLSTSIAWPNSNCVGNLKQPFYLQTNEENSLFGSVNLFKGVNVIDIRTK